LLVGLAFAQSTISPSDEGLELRELHPWDEAESWCPTQDVVWVAATVGIRGLHLDPKTCEAAYTRRTEWVLVLEPSTSWQ